MHVKVTGPGIQSHVINAHLYPLRKMAAFLYILLDTYFQWYIVNSSRDDKLSERVKKSRKNGTQLVIEPRTF